MKKNRIKDIFLKELRKIPIIQVACEKCDVSRQSVYRWRNTDEKFRKEMEEAMLEGETLVNEMSESMLLSLIKEKNWQALSFWLRARHPKFGNKIEVSSRIIEDENLTPEQEKIVRRAIKLTSFNSNNENYNEKDNA